MHCDVTSCRLTLRFPSDEVKQPAYCSGFYYDWQSLLSHLIADIAGSSVKFDERGDGLARYDILNYQRLINDTGYHYRVVGNWFNSLELNLEHVVWHKNATSPPASACSLPCGRGMIKKQQVCYCLRDSVRSTAGLPTAESKPNNQFNVG